VIQEREFMRLGGTETIKVDVRIIAACNVQLLNLVREGRFREDLYHRLNVIAVPLPALRERKEDVHLLLDHFLRIFSKENNRPLGRFTPAALRLLVDYDWPGNVRELENVVERAVVLSSQELLDVDLLPKACGRKNSWAACGCNSPNSCRRCRASTARAPARTARGLPYFKSWMKSSGA